MTTVRVHNVAQHVAGFYTAIVTADGADPVRVDNSLGAWTFPRDPMMPPDARCSRRVVRGWCVELLNLAVKTGQPQETRVHGTPVLRLPTPTPTTPEAIAQRMAQAGAAAVKEAA